MTDKFENFKIGHLYECYFLGGEKRLALYERDLCFGCGFVWNQNMDGEDCPRCGSSAMAILFTSKPPTFDN